MKKIDWSPNILNVFGILKVSSERVFGYDPYANIDESLNILGKPRGIYIKYIQTTKFVYTHNMEKKDMQMMKINTSLQFCVLHFVDLVVF